MKKKATHMVFIDVGEGKEMTLGYLDSRKTKMFVIRGNWTFTNDWIQILEGDKIFEITKMHNLLYIE